MTRLEHISLLKDTITSAKKIAIFWHNNIDWDALWSCLALWWVCEDLWKEVSYYTPSLPWSSFSFLPQTKKFKTTFDYHPHYDCIIICDTANPLQLLERFWVWHEDYFKDNTVFVIDHHWSNTRYWTHNIVDDSASSACEIIAEILLEMNSDWITPQIATYLFLWLSTDTWHFIYDKDSQRTFWIAKILLSKWAEKKLIVDSLYRSSSYKSIKFLWNLLERIQKQDWLIRSWYRKQEIIEHDIDKEKADSVLWVMTRVKHSWVFALIKIHDHEEKPFLKCSFRSKWEINASLLAEQFWGWWHKAASWCKQYISKDREASLQDFVSAVQNHLKDNS